MSDDKSGSGGNGEEVEAVPKRTELKIMEPEDRLRAENIQLKLMNLDLQEESLARQVRQLREDRSMLQKRYRDLRAELEKKYDVDLGKSEVRASDGAIVPQDKLQAQPLS